MTRSGLSSDEPEAAASLALLRGELRAAEEALVELLRRRPDDLESEERVAALRLAMGRGREAAETYALLVSRHLDGRDPWRAITCALSARAAEPAMKGLVGEVARGLAGAGDRAPGGRRPGGTEDGPGGGGFPFAELGPMALEALLAVLAALGSGRLERETRMSIQDDGGDEDGEEEALLELAGDSGVKLGEEVLTISDVVAGDLENLAHRARRKLRED